MIYHIVTGYLIFINLLGLILMAADKSKAKNHRWRIPEKVLFTVAVIGGSIGAWCGMYLFRHKTKHKSFVIGIPLILILQIVAILLIRSAAGYGYPV